VHEQRDEILQARTAERLQGLGHEALDRLGGERPGELAAQAFEPLSRCPRVIRSTSRSRSWVAIVQLLYLAGLRSAGCYLSTVVASIDRCKLMAIDLGAGAV